MKRRRSVKTEISLTIVVTVLLTVALLSVLANFFLDKQFVSYITETQQEKKGNIVEAIEGEYIGDPLEEPEPSQPVTPRRGHGKGEGQGHGMMRHWQSSLSDSWEVSNIERIGNSALYEGLIIHVFDTQHATVWSAQQHNSSMCRQVITDIGNRMQTRFGGGTGEFTSESYPIVKDGIPVGSVQISYYGPYYLTDSDFQFLTSLNRIILGVGAVSMGIALLVGLLLSRRLSLPILNTSKVAAEMASGDYSARIQESHGTRELNDLILSINHLGHTLEQQDALRQALSADVAHELRTPLTTVSTHLEAMIEGVWEPTPERLQSLYEELERITWLVQDLEDLTRLKHDVLRLNKEETNLWDLLDMALESFDYKLVENDLTISKIGTSTFALVDKERMYQVIYNLISNAIKFTPAGGEITLTTSKSGGNVILAVSDTGIGIPIEEQAYVFERFYRADKSRNRNTGGSGIGLAIAKTIVEAHGGSISLESETDKGTTFTVIIPVE